MLVQNVNHIQIDGNVRNILHAENVDILSFWGYNDYNHKNSTLVLKGTLRIYNYNQ